MLTKTTITAVQALLYVEAHGHDIPISPRRLAAILGTSPTYLAKVTTLLAKGGIVRSHRGARGGITIALPSEEINLLGIMQACQGQMVGGFCADTDDLESTCSFHQAMYEVHQATVKILSRWTLAELARRPLPVGSFANGSACLMKPLEAAETERST